MIILISVNIEKFAGILEKQSKSFLKTIFFASHGNSARRLRQVTTSVGGEEDGEDEAEEKGKGKGKGRNRKRNKGKGKGKGKGKANAN